ncbi:hypothetical protein XI00_19565 [Bradyrhizobium sp. CCBAU 21359]|nr:hypothetical protein [Bradyrhizobium sp. CCBAU 21359]
MSRFEQNRLEPCFFQARMQPLRQRPSLQPNSLHCKAKRLEKLNQGVGFARDLRFLQEFTLGIHNAYARQFQ